MGPHRRSQRGFTLLEAIVALVIFSLGAFALYGWLSTNLITLQRVEERAAMERATRTALDAVRRVNPLETPSGSRQVGALQVTWTSVAIMPPRDSVTQVGLPNLFQAGLYDLDVRVLEGEREIDGFHVRQVGYRQVRQMEPE